MIIHYKSKSCWICYQVIDHVLIDFLQKSQKSLDFRIVPLKITINQLILYKSIDYIVS